MQIYLPILALALGASAAIDEPNQICADFITVKVGAPQKSRSRRENSRVRRGSWFDTTDGATTEGMTTGGMTTSGVSTEQTTNVQTAAPTTELTTQQTDPVTTDPVTTDPVTTDKVTTAKATTTDRTHTTEEATTTTEATTTEKATTTERATTAVGTTDSVNEEDKAILVILDETGSMQDLGGPYQKGKKKGRDVVIKKMEKFREHLEDSVNSGGDDYPITFVTFNKAARWSKFNSIKDWPSVTKKDYNPGYQTNLFDTLGCVLSKYKSENPHQSVDVYLISDGVHKVKKRTTVVYDENKISEMVNELRDDFWNFHFFGATSVEKKSALKQQATRLGFREAERRVFSFNGQAFGSLLKTMLRSVAKNGKKVQLPECKVKFPCKKGRGGKFCRKGRKVKESAGKCKFY